MVVLAVLAVLTALVWVRAGVSKENRRRTQCQANLRQIGMALRLYTEDNRGLLPDCTANNRRFYGAVWPWDAHINLVAELERRGATRKYLYCPSNPQMNDERHWNYSRYSRGQLRVLGYVFLLPGCKDVSPELWRRNLTGDGRRKPEELELAADVTVCQEWNYTKVKGISLDRTSHLRRGFPAGGNILFEDGHVAWRPFDQMKHQIVGVAIWDF